MNLSNFIRESLTDGGFVITLSREQAKIFFKDIRHKNLDKFVDVIYDWWDANKNKDIYPPLRTNGKELKIGRSFAGVVKALDDAGIEYDNNSSRLAVDKISMSWGNGSPGGRSSNSRGLQFEHTVADDLKGIISELASGVEEVWTPNREYLRCIYDAGDLDGAVEYIKENPTDIDKVVVMTGSKDVARNKNGAIFDDRFNLNISNKRKTLKESGSIIADVQIIVPHQDPVNISVKMKEAQLSAITFHACMNKNLGFRRAIDTHTQYTDIKDKQFMVAFNRVFAMMGLDPEEVYNVYLDGLHIDTALDVHDPDNDDLRDFIQILLGGNYWYITPDPSHNLFVPWDKDINVYIDRSRKAGISAAGRQIKSPIKVAGGSGSPSIKLRCDSASWDYPMRFFFDNANVKELVDSMN